MQQKIERNIEQNRQAQAGTPKWPQNRALRTTSRKCDMTLGCSLVLLSCVCRSGPRVIQRCGNRALTPAIVHEQVSRVFFKYCRSVINAHHNNSATPRPKTKFPVRAEAPQKLSSRKGLRKLKFSEALALNMQVKPAMCYPNHKSSKSCGLTQKSSPESSHVDAFRSMSSWDHSCKFSENNHQSTGSIRIPLLTKSFLHPYGKTQ